MEFIASGGLSLRGCAGPIKVEKFYNYIYAIGSMVYIEKTAQKGILERVVIKRVNLVEPNAIINYVDRTNRVWEESELLPYSEAAAIAAASLERELSELGELNSCNSGHTITKVAICNS